MGIRVHCPNGHRLNLKSFLAGKRGICPRCGAKFDIPQVDPAEPGESNEDDVAATSVAVEDLQPAESSAAAPMVADPPSFAAVGVTASGVGVGFEPGATAAPLRQAETQTVSAAAEVTWYVRHPVHGQFGPANDETFRQWAAEGRITDDTLVWRNGWAEWRSAPSVLSLVAVVPDGAHIPAPSVGIVGISAPARASGAALIPMGGAAEQRAAARRKKNQTMRMVSLGLTIAVTLLTCLLIFVLTR